MKMHLRLGYLIQLPIYWLFENKHSAGTNLTVAYNIDIQKILHSCGEYDINIFKQHKNNFDIRKFSK